MATSCVLLCANMIAAQDWPQWRGPDRDAKAAAFAAPVAWPKELKQKWQITVGKGDASPALVGDKVFVFARQGDQEVTTCVEAATGKIVWEDKYVAEAVKGAAINMWGSQGGPRSSPVVAQGKICTYGIAGVLSCLDAGSGKLVWRKEPSGRPMFYTASSPMIVEGRCIAFVGGGKGALTSFDLASGEPTWAWTGAGEPYGSPVLMTVDGIKQVVTPTASGIAGIQLADGNLLWQVSFAGAMYMTSLGTPIVDGQTVIFFCPSKGETPKAAFALKIEKQGNEFRATELWRSSQPVAAFSTPVLRDGLLYGVAAGRSYFCMDAKTGATKWFDTTQRVSGHVVAAGSILLALNIDRNLVAFKADQEAYVELATYRVADSATWAYPVISGNRVFVKDTTTLTLWAFE